MKKEEKLEALRKLWDDKKYKKKQLELKDMLVEVYFEMIEERINKMMPAFPPLDSKGNEIPLDVLRDKMERLNYLDEPMLDDYGSIYYLF